MQEEISSDVPREFKTMLVFPPQWTPQNPHFAITSIAGHLRKHGHKVLMKDLNVEFYDHVLTPEFLKFTLNRINVNYNYLLTRVRLKTLIKDESLDSHLEAMKLLAIEEFFKEHAEFAGKLPDVILDAKETLRDPRRFYNPGLLVEALFTIDRALEVVSLPYHPSKISFNNFEQPHCMLATAHLIEHACDKSVNMFYEFFQEKADEILREKPDLIGISINSFSRVLAGLTLARLLKQKAPDNTVINIGGNFFMRVKEALMKRPEFFENFCHSLSLGEGEKQSLIMVEELKAGNGLTGVPDILYLDSEDEEPRVKYTFPQEPEKLDNIAPQDLEGLPLDLYFSPDMVLCLQASKGCYWGKCTFAARVIGG